ncbi:hypothetical protein SERLA73DRAFT_149128 [Serpula lacrymans var. lacrymans S7.3]|uniref:Uncharacterized protein n=1 Tax=Serpula lacrymans var. lacrymans (strain S7.3) TaxID=936435 RepID=F8PFG1_SERL3|nr:hypothetical protein SERLA73DRAFT_149128 [Serpula lacrymans var. lacrymans S7.3]
MSSETYQLLARTICMWSPTTPVHCRSQYPLATKSLPLNYKATFYDYVVINRERYNASYTAESIGLLLVDVPIEQSSVEGILNAYGEVLKLLVFNFGSLRNIWNQICSCPPSFPLTESRDTSLSRQSQLGLTGRKYGPQLTWQKPYSQGLQLEDLHGLLTIFKGCLALFWWGAELAPLVSIAVLSPQGKKHTVFIIKSSKETLSEPKLVSIIATASATLYLASNPGMPSHQHLATWHQALAAVVFQTLVGQCKLLLETSVFTSSGLPPGMVGTINKFIDKADINSMVNLLSPTWLSNGLKTIFIKETIYPHCPTPHTSPTYSTNIPATKNIMISLYPSINNRVQIFTDGSLINGRFLKLKL